MIGQYTLLLTNGKLYTGLSLVICIVWRHFLLDTLYAVIQSVGLKIKQLSQILDLIYKQIFKTKKL